MGNLISESGKSYIWTHILYLCLLFICSLIISFGMTIFSSSCPNLIRFMLCNGLPDNSQTCPGIKMIEEAATLGIPWISSFILFILICMLIHRRRKYAKYVNRFPMIIIYVSFAFIFFSMALTFSSYFRKIRPCENDENFKTGTCAKSTLNVNGEVMNAENLKGEIDTLNIFAIIIPAVAGIAIGLCIIFLILLSYKYTGSKYCTNLFDLECGTIDYDT